MSVALPPSTKQTASNRFDLPAKYAAQQSSLTARPVQPSTQSACLDTHGGKLLGRQPVKFNNDVPLDQRIWSTRLLSSISSIGGKLSPTFLRSSFPVNSLYFPWTISLISVPSYLSVGPIRSRGSQQYLRATAVPLPLRNRYFTTIGSSSVKTVADRNRLAAYHNKHCWRAFQWYQHRWPCTTLNPQNIGF